MGVFHKVWNLHNLMRNQWRSYEDLRELQNKKLRAIIKHAYKNVPFYHHKFREAGIRPNDIKTVRDLIKIPITTKREVQRFYQGLLSKGVNLNKCVTSDTSGSTGTPLTIVYDEKADDYEKAVALRPNLSCGQKIRDKWVVITTPVHIKPKRWFQRVGVFNPVYISIMMKTHEQLNIIRSVHPDIVDGYPSQIYLIAKEIHERGLDEIKLKIVFSTAESLDDKTREYISTVLDAEVYDQFGCVEVGRTAWECPERAGYHIDVDSVVTEFIEAGEQVESGESGEIVYTCLYNYAMPLIRYAVGDVGIPSDEKCPCGRGLPLMKILLGRKSDFLTSSSGELVSPFTLSPIMKHTKGIEEYRIIQEKEDRIKVQIKASNVSHETINQIEVGIRNILGKHTIVYFEFLNEIPRDHSGKLRRVVSKVNASLS